MREIAPTCPACKVYGNASKLGEEACEQCRVILMPENEDAARIYQLTNSQVIVGGEQIIALNHVAIWQAIDRYKVREPVKVFEMVNMVFHFFLKKDRDNEN